MAVALEQAPAQLDLARNAVANAMMAALAYQLDYHLKRVGQYGQGRIFEDLKGIQEVQTRQMCEQACNAVIKHLSHPKRQQFFSGMGLLSSERGLKHYDGHQYFLVKDQEDKWFAGSPANYVQGKTPNPLTNLIEGDLSVVLSQMQEIDGGVWPSQEYIEQTYATHDFRMPRFYSQAGVLGTIALSRKGIFFPRDQTYIVPLV